MHTKQTIRTTMKKVNGDLLTPISIFQRLHGTRKFLLESSDKYDGAGRYSFIGANPRKRYSGTATTLTDFSYLADKHYVYEGELLRSMKQVMPRISNQTAFPFTGGAIGFIDTTHSQAMFHIYDTLVIFDHLTDEVTVFHTNIEAEHTAPNLDEILTQLFTAKNSAQTSYQLSTFDERQGYEAQFNGDAFALYRKMRVELAAAYLYYMEFDGQTILGASEESLLSVQHGHVSANLLTPIHDDVTATFETICENGSVHTDVSTERTTKVTGSLRPTLHPIEALAKFVPADGAIGYIGFNGQLDFTQKTRSVTITQDKAMLTVANEADLAIFQALANGGDVS